MPIDPTAGLTATTGAAAPAAPSGLGQLGADGFLQLLIAQLKYQNPLSPSDPNAMLQQTSQLAQVQTIQEVAASQQRLLGLQQAAMSAELLGRSVTALDAAGDEVTGTVDAVRFTETGPVLVIGDREVAFSSASELRSTTTS